jgi:hypothetical protein
VNGRLRKGQIESESAGTLAEAVDPKVRILGGGRLATTAVCVEASEHRIDALPFPIRTTIGIGFLWM